MIWRACTGPRAAFEPEDLTFDHVIPVSQGGRRGWETGMVLQRKPRRPTVLAPTVKLSIGWRTPASWHSYL